MSASAVNVLSTARTFYPILALRALFSLDYVPKKSFSFNIIIINGMCVVNYISFVFDARFTNMHISSAVHTVVLVANRAKMLINIFWFDKSILAPSSGTLDHVFVLVK